MTNQYGTTNEYTIDASTDYRGYKEKQYEKAGIDPHETYIYRSGETTIGIHEDSYRFMPEVQFSLPKYHDWDRPERTLGFYNRISDMNFTGTRFYNTIALAMNTIKPSIYENNGTPLIVYNYGEQQDPFVEPLSFAMEKRLENPRSESEWQSHTSGIYAAYSWRSVTNGDNISSDYREESIYSYSNPNATNQVTQTARKYDPNVINTKIEAIYVEFEPDGLAPIQLPQLKQWHKGSGLGISHPNGLKSYHILKLETASQVREKLTVDRKVETGSWTDHRLNGGVWVWLSCGHVIPRSEYDGSEHEDSTCPECGEMSSYLYSSSAYDPFNGSSEPTDRVNSWKTDTISESRIYKGVDKVRVQHTAKINSNVRYAKSQKANPGIIMNGEAFIKRYGVNERPQGWTR